MGRQCFMCVFMTFGSACAMQMQFSDGLLCLCAVFCKVLFPFYYYFYCGSVWQHTP